MQKFQNKCTGTLFYLCIGYSQKYNKILYCTAYIILYTPCTCHSNKTKRKKNYENGEFCWRREKIHNKQWDNEKWLYAKANIMSTKQMAMKFFPVIFGIFGVLLLLLHYAWLHQDKQYNAFWFIIYIDKMTQIRWFLKREEYFQRSCFISIAIKISTTCTFPTL